MEVILLLLQMFLTIWCAYIAGQLKATLDVDRIDGRPFNWVIALLIIGNILASVFNVISIYGQGLTR